jgi:hypothetical protein
MTKMELGPNARAFISPSDLTYGWDNCHRCLWLYYNHQVKAPLTMPLVGDLAEMQELSYIGKSSVDMHPDMPEGKVHKHAGWVVSKPIIVDGVETPFAVRGKYDLLMEHPDGTFGIVDCKFQAKQSDKSKFYAAQLEAYAFALENPAKDAPVSISTAGLLVWAPVKIRGKSNENFGMELSCAWYPTNRDPAFIASRLTEFIKMITGDCPPSKDNCEQCRYLETRNNILAGI